MRTINGPGIARAGRPVVQQAPSRGPPEWVRHLFDSGEAPWSDFAGFIRPGAGHWKEGNRFYVMPLATSGNMPCPIASDRRKHRSNESYILFDDHSWTGYYR